MLKNVAVSILICYALILFQTSFLVHFWPANLIIFLMIFINIFEKQEKSLGLVFAFIGGFLLDIFSGNFIGFYLLILLAAAFFLKFVLARYLRIPKISWI
jgi:rod shape-determining protein MreD